MSTKRERYVCVQRERGRERESVCVVCACVCMCVANYRDFELLKKDVLKERKKFLVDVCTVGKV